MICPIVYEEWRWLLLKLKLLKLLKLVCKKCGYFRSVKKIVEFKIGLNVLVLCATFFNTLCDCQDVWSLQGKFLLQVQMETNTIHVHLLSRLSVTENSQRTHCLGRWLIKYWFTYSPEFSFFHTLSKEQRKALELENTRKKKPWECRHTHCPGTGFLKPAEHSSAFWRVNDFWWDPCDSLGSVGLWTAEGQQVFAFYYIKQCPAVAFSNMQ